MDRKIDILLGRWVHSGEEDTEDAFVFRRQGYTLPPSRGRQQIEFYSDNQVKIAGIGAVDLHRIAGGTWAPATGLATNFDFIVEDEDGPRRIELTDDGAPMLKLKKRSGE